MATDGMAIVTLMVIMAEMTIMIVLVNRTVVRFHETMHSLNAGKPDLPPPAYSEDPSRLQQCAADYHKTMVHTKQLGRLAAMIVSAAHACPRSKRKNHAHHRCLWAHVDVSPHPVPHSALDDSGDLGRGKDCSPPPSLARGEAAPVGGAA